MKLIGLTGGIGMGKSTAAELLVQRGITIVDTDQIARQVVAPGQPALAEIQAAFGADIIGPDGQVLRAELAKRVFGDEAARKKLEAILHPRIRASWLQQTNALRTKGIAACVVVIPLLFEANAASNFDVTVCVACSAATQRQRLAPRGWSDQQIEQRMRAQLPIEKKMTLSDYVIWTEGSLDVHARQWERIVRRITP